MFAENIQTADVGLTRGYLEGYLKSCGYWANEERQKQLGFVLSPSVYIASSRQEGDLERMARATYHAVSLLNLALVESGSKNNHVKEEARFLQLANSASRGLLRPKDGEKRIPPMIKVDLVQDPLGNYRIAEVDTYNPRGFGFAAMLEESLTPNLKLRRFPGMAQLCRILKASGVDEYLPWFVAISEFERFYRPTYEIFASSLRRRGLHFSEIDANRLYRVLSSNENIQMRAGVLSIPDTLFRESSEVREGLLSLYRSGDLQAVYPPVAYLGSKAFLPYLRMFSGMSEFIPETTLVGRGYDSDYLLSGDQFARKPVLKATVSSGMKGVYFPELDPEEYAKTLAQAKTQKNASWILQEQVEQVPVPVVVFDDDGNRIVRDYYLRLTAYISAEGIVDVEVTGRPDRKVHGAPDCIQLPVVLS